MKKKLIPIPELIIFALILITMLLIYPGNKLVRTNYSSASLNRGLSGNISLTEEPVLIEFTPLYNKLTEISFKIQRNTTLNTSGSIYLNLYDQNMTLVSTSNYEINSISNSLMTDFPVSATVDPEKTYYIELTASDYNELPVLLYSGSSTTACEEFLSVFLNGQVQENLSPYIEISYKATLDFTRALCYELVVLCIGILLLCAVYLGRRAQENSNKCFVKAGILVFSVLAIECCILMNNESYTPVHMTGDDMVEINGFVKYNMLFANESDDVSGALGRTTTMLLDHDHYTIGIEYSVPDNENYFIVYVNGKAYATYYLKSDLTYDTFELPLQQDAQEVSIYFYYTGNGSVSIYSCDLSAENGFYNDTGFMAILFLIIVAVLLLTRLYDYLRHQKASVDYTTAVLIFGISMVASMPLLNNTLVWGDDIAYHLIRIEGIKDGLRDGQFPVMVYPEGLNGFGYLNAMYPNLFLYIPAFLRLAGVSIVTSYKFLLLLANLGCVSLTYTAIHSLKISKRTALCAAGIYTLAPYHFTNFYARAALGESLAMVFIPIALIGLYHIIAGNRKKSWMLILGISGLIQTHVLSALIACIICVIGAILFIIPIIREKRILTIIRSLIVIILLNLWFIVPFLYYYLFGNLRLDAVDWSNYSEYSLYFSEFLGTNGDSQYRQLTLGIPIAVFAILALVYIVRERNKHDLEKSYTTFLLVLAGIFTFMATSQFSSSKLMRIAIFDSFFSTMQFPSRMLGIACALFIIVGAITMERCELFKGYRNVLIITLFLIASVATATEYSEAYPYETYTDTYTTGHYQKVVGIPKSSNTNVYPYEWRTKGLSDSIIDAGALQAGSDAVEFYDFTRKGTTSVLTYSSTVAEQNILLPVTYYKGYSMTDEFNQTIPVWRSATGQVTFRAADDGITHTYTLRYTSCILFIASVWISIFTLFSIVIYLILKKYYSNIY